MITAPLRTEIDSTRASVAVHGPLTGENAATFLTTIAESVPASTQISVDVTDTSLIDSSGLGALRALARRHRMHSGDLVVVGASPHVTDLLDLIGVPHDDTATTP